MTVQMMTKERNVRTTLDQGRPQDRCLEELRFAHALAPGTVKQNRVTVGFPDRGQLHAARSVQAKENAAWTPAANQDSLGYVKGANL